MSDKELNRVNVIQAVCEKRLRRSDAASQLELAERQIQRLVNRTVSQVPLDWLTATWESPAITL